MATNVYDQTMGRPVGGDRAGARKGGPMEHALRGPGRGGAERGATGRTLHRCRGVSRDPRSGHSGAQGAPWRAARAKVRVVDPPRRWAKTRASSAVEVRATAQATERLTGAASGGASRACRASAAARRGAGPAAAAEPREACARGRPTGCRPSRARRRATRAQTRRGHRGARGGGQRGAPELTPPPACRLAIFGWRAGTEIPKNSKNIRKNRKKS